MRTNSGGSAGLRRWITTSALAAAGLLFAKPAAAQVSVSVFGDVDYQAMRDNGSAASPAGTTNAFSAPRLELFLTSTQGKLAFLAETMFEVGDFNEFGIDMERIEIGYLFSDKFRLRVGRFHTAIGYYNDAYHHGRYFQMTVDRPTMVRFEDEGGLIPAHSVGLHGDGRLPLGAAGNLRYDAEVTNGRGSTPGEVDNLTDPNNGKMYNLRLRFEPSAIDGLVIGGSATYDVIAAAPDATGTLPLVSIREMILGASPRLPRESDPRHRRVHVHSAPQRQPRAGPATPSRRSSSSATTRASSGRTCAASWRTSRPTPRPTIPSSRRTRSS